MEGSMLGQLLATGICSGVVGRGIEQRRPQLLNATQGTQGT